MISKFYFLHVLFSFMSQSLVLKKNSFKMLVVFSPIYVTDAKMIFRYDFVASFKSELIFAHAFYFLITLHVADMYLASCQTTVIQVFTNGSIIDTLQVL